MVRLVLIRAVPVSLRWKSRSGRATEVEVSCLHEDTRLTRLFRVANIESENNPFAPSSPLPAGFLIQSLILLLYPSVRCFAFNYVGMNDNVTAGVHLIHRAKLNALATPRSYLAS